MSVFPKMGRIDDSVMATIESRAGKNLDVSKLVAWLRVSSAVDGGLVLETVPDGQTFAATYGDGKSLSGRVGVDFSGNSVYGEGGDRLHRPSPVIESVTIENGHQGLSRKAQFSIKCFTLNQAEKLTQYFYQPGYMVLVEYGWNVKESFEQRPEFKDASTGACEMAKFNSYAYITELRARSKGTYDGFLGRITGGGYKSGNDETYIIDVELTTLGEIPTYLQVHRSGIAPAVKTANGEEQVVDTGLRYKVSEIEAAANSSVGLGLFQQMYNKLPNEKRSRRVKYLSSGTDVNGEPWTSDFNFINVDEEIRTKMMDDLAGNLRVLKAIGAGLRNTFSANEERDAIRRGAGTNTVTDPTNTNKVFNADIPEGLELLSDQSYIRLELAFAIINSYAANLESVTTEKCSGDTPTYSYVVNTVDTVIGAHKWMFSTDGSKLFIPNTNHPTFKLHLAFSKTEQENLNVVDFNALGTETGNFANYNPAGNDYRYAFPSPNPYIAPIEPDGVIQRSADAYEWGYLRNLFVNLDFFVDVMTRSNYVAKDIYYELLNGLSSAVGSYWQFELIERPHVAEPKSSSPLAQIRDAKPYVEGIDNATKSVTEWKAPEVPFETTFANMTFPKPLSTAYWYEMGVEDMNFLGGRKVGNDQVKKFYSKGVESPFLESQLDMPIPASMRSHILGKASSANIQTKSEGIDQKYKGIFRMDLCPVTKIIDSFQKEVKQDKTKEPESKPADADEVLKANFEMYMRMATVLPRNQDRKYTYPSNLDLNKELYVGAWKDINILKQFEQEFKKTGSARDDKTASAILSIEFSFTIHGVSGLKVGDIFQLYDVPSAYKNGVFQIMEQTHELSGGLWKTTVKAKMRDFTLTTSTNE